MSDQAILRITREIRQIQQGTDLSLGVAYHESDIRSVKALIVGPPDTPYEFGFFEFSIKFPRDYPASPPNVNALTTNAGRCRFNPNIYAGGKVCLSILGTWRGERGEEWSSAQGLESILISIQSLMSSNPYENEPGYEDAKGPEDLKAMGQYVAKIQHETLRIAVIRPLEDALGIQKDGTVIPQGKSLNASDDEEDTFAYDDARWFFKPFEDLRKRRFLWYYESYMQAIEAASQKVKKNEKFETMTFEHPGNSMDGTFNYPNLKSRLEFIKETLTNETERWGVHGLESKKNESSIANNIQRQHDQIKEELNSRKSFSVDISLADGNPFVWTITYFGRPMTHLDGGVFKIKMYLSTSFPEEQPRVFVETPIFHQRVSKDGVLCYFPSRSEELKYHIDAIVQALEEESPPFDPRTTVNLEASKLFWGTPDERKRYNRALRRSVEKSAE
ncbi:ubiquitin conjugating enzyme [Talaromyces proteolyticus]|uniref:Ubiquitin-conjugating enzyme E2 Z n=1 Tax=Talaromyces proteolyticus TaxID=1131652 RepID=A0AAD4KH31_9EURO|nr:ubiquitin conjugating enzyme [Talaromyces proteolyticus]KAH8691999.1 ubiquitin conjugating enzyme [Talaromyces proteolyticus]